MNAYNLTRGVRCHEEIYYVNFNLGLIEHGYIIYRVYKEGDLISFDVEFDDMFAEYRYGFFPGDVYGKLIFGSRELAQKVFYKGDADRREAWMRIFNSIERYRERMKLNGGI